MSNDFCRSRTDCVDQRVDQLNNFESYQKSIQLALRFRGDAQNLGEK